jgi:hypothetical protein
VGPVIGLRVIRLAAGAAELLLPEQLVTPVVGRKPDEEELVMCQILGARSIVQALFPQSAPAGRFATGPTLDVLHALSMVGLAVVSERYRRMAIANAAEAFAIAALASRSSR